LRSREGGINEEVGDAVVGLGWLKAGGMRWESASGGTVSWIEGAWDILCKEAAVGLVNEVVKAAESNVDMSVAGTSLVPAFDDDSVVAV